MGIDRIRAYYGRVPETARFSSPQGELEFARTKLVIERRLPPAPARILDVGGAVGHYAFWLAGLGHRVALVDAAEAHVAAARERNAESTHRLESIAEGDARSLEMPDATFDMALNMGPMYHLQERRDRVAALREIRRVLRPEGLVVSAYISRFASLLDGYHDPSFMADPAYIELVDRDLETGEHLPPEHDRYFTEAYFHRPEEIGAELDEAGLRDAELMAVESFAWTLPDLGARLADPLERERLFRYLDKVEREPSLMGSSAHILSGAWKARHSGTPLGRPGERRPR